MSDNDETTKLYIYISTTRPFCGHATVRYSHN